MMLIFCPIRTFKENIVKSTGSDLKRECSLTKFCFSSMREEGEGHHISLSHSVANTDPKRQELSTYLSLYSLFFDKQTLSLTIFCRWSVKSMNHVEGGWPAEVKVQFIEYRNKFIRKIVKEEMFVFTITKV